MERGSGDLTTIADADFDAGATSSLAENEVCLWSIHLDKIAQAEPRWRTLLSKEELTRADRFHFIQDRQTFTATRALLRIILASYIGCEPAVVTIGYSEKGKPLLGPKHQGTGLQFSVSHSGARALLAFAKLREVGVDVELIRNNLDCKSLSRRYFSPAEQTALAALQGSDLCKGFFRCWTRKEAYVKARGMGLALPLHDFDVSINPGEQRILLATRPHPHEASQWSLCEVELGDGYAAALCVRGHDWKLKRSADHLQTAQMRARRRRSALEKNQQARRQESAPLRRRVRPPQQSDTRL